MPSKLILRRPFTFCAAVFSGISAADIFLRGRSAPVVVPCWHRRYSFVVAVSSRLGTSDFHVICLVVFSKFSLLVYAINSCLPSKLIPRRPFHVPRCRAFRYISCRHCWHRRYSLAVFSLSARRIPTPYLFPHSFLVIAPLPEVRSFQFLQTWSSVSRLFFPPLISCWVLPSVAAAH